MATVLRTFEMKKHCGLGTAKVTLKLETLAGKSPICIGEEHASLPLSIVDWLDDVGAGTAEFAIVARCGGEIVGFVRWENESEEYTFLRGTYVKPGWRNLGLARSMWAEAIKHFRGKIDVVTTSAGGDALVQSMRKRYGGYEWFHEAH